LGALLLVAVTGIYLACGRFKSCLVTDMMQGILTWLAMIVPTVAIFFIMGEGNPVVGWHQIISYFTEGNMGNLLEFRTVVGPTAPYETHTHSYISAMPIMHVLM
jgi:Na+/pantothenate symporter